MSLHDRDERLEQTILDAARERLTADRPALGRTQPPEAFAPAITATGLGAERAAALLLDTVMPSAIADRPSALPRVHPGARRPGVRALRPPLAVSSIYGGSWLEGSGAVYAENEALRWLADLAGLPEGAGGCLRPGRHARQPVGARRRARATRGAAAGGARAERWLVACSADAHSSIAHAARVMDVDLLAVPRRARPAHRRRAAARRCRRRRRRRVRRRRHRRHDQLRIVDDLAGIAAVCRERGLWLHVDGAYGVAALCAPSARGRFAGHRARRLVHRRPAQVAVLAVRLLRARLPRPGAGPRRPPPAAPLPRRASPTTPTSGTRPTTRPPHPPGARAALLVLARRPRHATRTPTAIESTLALTRVGRGRDPRRAPSSSCCASPTVRPRVPPPRLADRATTTLVRPAARRRHRVRDADPVHGRDRRRGSRS